MKGWKQYIEPFPSKGVFELFEKLWTAMGAPERMALFARTSSEYTAEIWLLTPEAATAFGDKLPGIWTDAPDPAALGWSLMIGHADAHRKFGLRTPAQIIDGQ
jgi:hypothetical protein